MTFQSSEDCLLYLKENYTEPKHPLFSAGVSNIYRYFKGKLKLAEIKKFLGSIENYTLHREYKNLPRNPSYSHFKRYQIQIDLIDIQQFAKWNNGVKYLLAAIDTFTRRAWLKPCKDKSTTTVLQAFREIIEECGKPPLTLVADKGTEVKNKIFIEFCKKKKLTFPQPYFHPRLVC